jgi:predicted nuclease with TOPRIM domain
MGWRAFDPRLFMLNSESTQMGLGGLIVWLTIKELFSFLKNRKENSQDKSEKLEEYVKDLTELSEQLTQLLDRMQSHCRAVHDSQIRLEAKFDNLNHPLK